MEGYEFSGVWDSLNRTIRPENVFFRFVFLLGEEKEQGG